MLIIRVIPAARARLAGRGVIAPDAFADLVVLDQDYRVRQTYVAGVEALEPRP